MTVLLNMVTSTEIKKESQMLPGLKKIYFVGFNNFITSSCLKIMLSKQKRKIEQKHIGEHRYRSLCLSLACKASDLPLISCTHYKNMCNRSYNLNMLHSQIDCFYNKAYKYIPFSVFKNTPAEYDMFKEER